MNLPNKLTLLRVILVPFVVGVLLFPSDIPHSWLFAGILFGIAAYTDRLDGKIARRDHLITDFGKFMDPLADKVLVVSVLCCLIELGIAPSWCVIVIIAREFMVTSLRLVAGQKGTVIAANIWGKVKTVSQIIAIVVVMVCEYIRQLSSYGYDLGTFSGEGFLNKVCPVLEYVFLLIATCLTIISGVIYLRQNWDAVKTAK